ncbi:PilZ domain-containing protein [Sphingomonas melonis]|uniref:PilZ domain-containing protein n=1 Tax=Sphingomonas melonis TaxID=152682 RepID=UPI0015CC04E0|nr:PilZ domain-containing protein [Sphingomonas melonis]
MESKPASDTDRPARPSRQSVFLTAIVERFGTRESTRHRVRDLSAGGMRIDQAEGLHVRETVLVTVGLLQAVGATVVWIDKGWAGIKFAVDVNPDEARGKAALSPQNIKVPAGTTPMVVPSAGWITDLSTPYRKK